MLSLRGRLLGLICQLIVVLHHLSTVSSGVGFHLLLASDPTALVLLHPDRVADRKPAIFDTDASLGITFDLQDFAGPLCTPDGYLRLAGMAQGLAICGIGPVLWTFWDKNGSDLTISSQCEYIPHAKMRLLSTQHCLFNTNTGTMGKFEGTESQLIFHFTGFPRLIFEYDTRNHLPIGYAEIGCRHISNQAELHLSLARSVNTPWWKDENFLWYVEASVKRRLNETNGARNVSPTDLFQP
jgi:hypothetical protein